jgi:hypothetical protein
MTVFVAVTRVALVPRVAWVAARKASNLTDPSNPANLPNPGNLANPDYLSN